MVQTTDQSSSIVTENNALRLKNKELEEELHKQAGRSKHPADL